MTLIRGPLALSGSPGPGTGSARAPLRRDGQTLAAGCGLATEPCETLCQGVHHHATGPFSLAEAEAAMFGFGQRAGAAWDKVMRLAFRVDGYEHQNGSRRSGREAR
jgi:hypothetical protein